MKIRIYYEDVDIGGIVYHTKYINFCERARSEIFFAQGKLPVFEEYHFVVKNLQANFLQPAYFGEEIEVKTQLRQMKRTSLILVQQIYRNQELLFSMDITLVCLKKDKIAKIPPYFLEVFASLQS
ncbi:acyl-CoA thioester hydrolase [Nitratiruptor sp. YY08-26]|uniref:YbgC/FadM family acyl-CoA thioesterase n=1 Tax=unclassified Nitratiruptor TaxID=2624044 RepID=UPI0019155DA2|nr:MULTISPECIES: YbgC/FadM family acyl-CoA thioesterase [unclassified Nitratiruptor]BCD62498.1 acyl-CoA thioester hydrolase [Nitratiruptor sp. YY08-13]BCD66434.1 acyl-CoA thioester hydrolase [Nitratiruptor sp. YY08-26]